MSTWRLLGRHSIMYYGLAAPAIITEVLLLNTFFASANSISSSIQNLTPAIFGLRSLVPTVVQVVPWLFLALSFYALLAFKPSLTVTILTIFFLVLTSLVGQVDFYLAALVIVSTFSSLIGFNFARAAKVVSKRKVNAESHGPPIYHVATLSFDLALPVGAALGIMAVVAYVVSIIQAQVRLLPQPLATLGTLYLESHFYLIMTTLSVAGAGVWAMHELIEPIILRYTMNHDEALVQARLEMADITKKIRRETKLPGRGRTALAGLPILAVLLLVYTIFTSGPLQLLNDLLAILGLARVQPSHTELIIGNIAENTARIIDRWIVTIQDWARFIIQLLWG